MDKYIWWKKKANTKATCKKATVSTGVFVLFVFPFIFNNSKRATELYASNVLICIVGQARLYSYGHFISINVF